MIDSQMFANLKERGLKTPALVISDAHSGLVAAIRRSFPGASWQRCKVHCMRNILAHVPQKSKAAFANGLKKLWLAPAAVGARERAAALCERYATRYPKAIETLENGLEASLTFYAFPGLDSRKNASTNMCAACYDLSYGVFRGLVGLPCLYSQTIPYRCAARCGLILLLDSHKLRNFLDTIVKKNGPEKQSAPRARYIFIS